MIDPKTIRFSYSLLKQVRKSPLRALLLRDMEKIPSTYEQLFCLAVECAIQEPERFEQEYAVFMPEDGKSDRRGTTVWKEQEKKVGRGKLLKQDQYDKIMRIQENVFKDPVVRHVYSSGDAQVKLNWMENEIECIGYVDFMSHTVPCAIDIKVVSDASDEAVSRLIFKDENMWHVQAAMYRIGARACGREYAYSGLLFVEDKPPYLSNAIQFTDKQLELGEREFEETLKAWEKAVKTGKFEGYGFGFKEIKTPGYISRKLYEDDY